MEETNPLDLITVSSKAMRCSGQGLANPVAAGAAVTVDAAFAGVEVVALAGVVGLEAPAVFFEAYFKMVSISAFMNFSVPLAVYKV